MAIGYQSGNRLFYCFCYKRNYSKACSVEHLFKNGISLRFFQAFMPLIGWLGASRFSHLIEDYDHWIAFGLLSFLGFRMIYHYFKKGEESTFDPRRLKIILTLAVATSIDALAIGISFAFTGYKSLEEMFLPLLIIGFVSFVISLIGNFIGIFVGKRINLCVELLGGLVLIGIGVKILIEHLCS